ncbi:MAG: peptidase S41 [Bacteroidales bacterium]|nr:MAG: peptidase S41 [Bacteroidales bacterium]
MYRKYFVVVCGVVVSLLSFSQTPVSQLQMQKMNQVLYAVKNLYVDTVNDSQMVDDAIRGMLENLDPHSLYIPAKEVQMANEPLQGSFDGIGVQFQIQKDTLVVVNPLRNCPAEKVGVLMGDKVISVDGKTVAGVKMPTQEIMKLLRGKRGTKVVVTIVRSGVQKPIDFVIVRDKIPLYSVEVAYEIAPKVGYINISSFSMTTTKEFRSALRMLEKKGITSLIIDLQMNGGGVMSAALDVLDECMPSKRELLFTKGENLPRQSYYSRTNDYFKGNIVVLIDEYSASASEIVAGAFQDWDRAVVVGRRSFGKGLVQRPFNLLDGSEIRLTIARYYTPSGRNIQKPYDGGMDKYRKELWGRRNHGELQNVDSINFPDSLKYKTLLLERTVYGGGGIMPDVFVPLDTTRFNDFHRNIVAKGILNQEILTFVEKEKHSIKQKYSDFNAFSHSYVVPEQLFEKLIQEAKKNNVESPIEQVQLSKPTIMLQIKALLARTIYEQGDYYKIINIENDIVQKGLEVINNFSNYLNEK